jgi:hypothetical protein
MGDMTTTTFTPATLPAQPRRARTARTPGLSVAEATAAPVPASSPPPGSPPGATASGPHGADHRSRSLVGDAVRAVKVFAGAAFGVAVLGEYGNHR